MEERETSFSGRLKRNAIGIQIVPHHFIEHSEEPRIIRLFEDDGDGPGSERKAILQTAPMSAMAAQDSEGKRVDRSKPACGLADWFELCTSSAELWDAG